MFGTDCGNRGAGDERNPRVPDRGEDQQARCRTVVDHDLGAESNESTDADEPPSPVLVAPCIPRA